jgi:membrane-associated phospholipid phosphatase
MTSHRVTTLLLALLVISAAPSAHAQSSTADSSFHPYHINYWVTGSIIGVGLTTNYLGVTRVLGKSAISPLELQSLNKGIVNGIDSWALRQDVTNFSSYAAYSDYTVATSVVLPALLLFDKQIRRDWSDVLLMYVETMSITPNIYEWSPLGPTFQNRIRPASYYEQLTTGQRESGNNRNSFYSGHVAVVAASTFFLVKVYSDYHPEIGNNKYLFYGAATIPPLLLGYFRVRALQHFPSDIVVGMGVGALCGILIPELHHFQNQNLSIGLYSSSESTGLTMKWQPEFLK